MITKFYEWVAFILILVGGFNWGFVGLLNINLISAILGAGFLTRFFLICIGVASGYLCYQIYVTKFKRSAPPPVPPVG